MTSYLFGLSFIALIALVTIICFALLVIWPRARRYGERACTLILLKIWLEVYLWNLPKRVLSNNESERLIAEMNITQELACTLELLTIEAFRDVMGPEAPRLPFYVEVEIMLALLRLVRKRRPDVFLESLKYAQNDIEDRKKEDVTGRGFGFLFHLGQDHALWWDSFYARLEPFRRKRDYITVTSSY
jgi:hypothetical protein